MMRRRSDPPDGTQDDRRAERPSEPCRGGDGYQLFPRAIVGGDDAGWAAVVNRYWPQLERSARTDRRCAGTGEEPAALANRALERLWRGVGPDRFAGFPNASSLHGYIRRCVHRLVVDAARGRAREWRRAEAL